MTPPPSHQVNFQCEHELLATMDRLPGKRVFHIHEALRMYLAPHRKNQAPANHAMVETPVPEVEPPVDRLPALTPEEKQQCYEAARIDGVYEPAVNARLKLELQQKRAAELSGASTLNQVDASTDADTLMGDS